ncbi:13689_t:CDS:2 [Rhizophagus irregularis]|nr:13689_t:CDS:2 [Rhizophagus irregularis]
MSLKYWLLAKNDENNKPTVKVILIIKMEEFLRAKQQMQQMLIRLEQANV